MSRSSFRDKLRRTESCVYEYVAEHTTASIELLPKKHSKYPNIVAVIWSRGGKVRKTSKPGEWTPKLGPNPSDGIVNFVSLDKSGLLDHSTCVFQATLHRKPNSDNFEKKKWKVALVEVNGEHSSIELAYLYINLADYVKAGKETWQETFILRPAEGVRRASLNLTITSAPCANERDEYASSEAGHSDLTSDLHTSSVRLDASFEDGLNMSRNSNDNTTPNRRKTLDDISNIAKKNSENDSALQTKSSGGFVKRHLSFRRSKKQTMELDLPTRSSSLIEHSSSRMQKHGTPSPQITPKFTPTPESSLPAVSEDRICTTSDLLLHPPIAGAESGDSDFDSPTEPDVVIHVPPSPVTFSEEILGWLKAMLAPYPSLQVEKIQACHSLTVSKAICVVLHRYNPTELHDPNCFLYKKSAEDVLKLAIAVEPDLPSIKDLLEAPDMTTKLIYDCFNELYSVYAPIIDEVDERGPEECNRTVGIESDDGVEHATTAENNHAFALVHEKMVRDSPRDGLIMTCSGEVDPVIEHSPKKKEVPVSMSYHGALSSSNDTTFKDQTALAEKNNRVEKRSHSSSKDSNSKMRLSASMDIPKPVKKPATSELDLAQIIWNERKHEIVKDLQQIDYEMALLNEKRESLEPQIREVLNPGSSLRDQGNKLMQEWCRIVHEKDKLMHRKEEIEFNEEQLNLEEKNRQILEELRLLLNKPDEEKTSQDLQREQKLMDDMQTLVNERNALVEKAEERRAKYANDVDEEEIMTMISKHDFNRSGNEEKCHLM